MANSKSTRRALVTSALAILMCVAMLIGTTFAWFTDTASTAVNRIQAGNLKLSLVNADEEDLTNSKIQWTAKGADNKQHPVENPLWEPGCTYRTEQFYLRNDGNLALKYKINLSFTGDTKLLEVLEFSTLVSGDNVPGGMITLKSLDELNGYEGYLLPASESVSGTDPEYVGFKITAKMKTTAGNEYQGLNLGDMNITVVATQYTYEYDSTGKDYDKDATYPATVSEIKAKYGVDGLSMPEGVKITKAADGVKGHFEITLEDEEAFLYFTQVFDRKAALAARTEALNNGTATRYEGESTHNSLNIWYYENAVTLKMGCDIDLNGITVNPFSFGGIYFDGQGHTIKNAKLTATSGDVGFFTRGATIRNVVFDNIQVSATGCDCAGVAVGSTNTNITNVTVTNCSVIGAKYTGAVVGYNYGSVTNCVVENTVVSGQYKVGGIIGYICEDAGKPVSVTGNKLTDVTVKGEKLWSGKTDFVIGKVVGNWNAMEGTCKDNTFSGTTTATNDIGEVETRAEAGLNR